VKKKKNQNIEKKSPLKLFICVRDCAAFTPTNKFPSINIKHIYFNDPSF